MVLLHNDGILPLDKSRISSIAVIGPNADSRAALLGNYNGTPDRSVTFLEGIQDAFDGRVYYAEGCQLSVTERRVLHCPATDMPRRLRRARRRMSLLYAWDLTLLLRARRATQETSLHRGISRISDCLRFSECFCRS